MVNSREAILKTLLYSEIFDYPLTREEIHKFLISNKKVSKSKVFKDLIFLKNKISSSSNYFFIKNKKELIAKRIRREKESEKKLILAVKIIKKITFIPTLKFVGISGALSMKNSEKEDDIDLFVITEEKTIWISRLILVATLKFLGVYREKRRKNSKNKICLNMIIDEKNMLFQKRDKNLYTAHEIAQLIPVFDKNNTYKKFIKQNFWINDFLPNFKFDKKPYFKSKSNLLDDSIVNMLINSSIENFSELLQKRYMNKSITNEKVEEGFLAFHPFDYKNFTLKKYEQKIKKAKLN